MTETMPFEKVNLMESKPFWKRSPELFLKAHKNAMVFKLFEWNGTEDASSITKFVARYIAGLPTDTPADLVQKLIPLLIETWEKQPASQPLETA